MNQISEMNQKTLLRCWLAKLIKLIELNLKLDKVKFRVSFIVVFVLHWSASKIRKRKKENRMRLGWSLWFQFSGKSESGFGFWHPIPTFSISDVEFVRKCARIPADSASEIEKFRIGFQKPRSDSTSQIWNHKDRPNIK